MELEDMPSTELKWIDSLKHGHSSIQNGVYDSLFNSIDITEFKSRTITEMTEIMTECAQVIQHANAMKDDRICTCKDKRGDKP